MLKLFLRWPAPNPIMVNRTGGSELGIEPSWTMRNAAASFQRLRSFVLQGIEGCTVYLDDIVIFSQTWEEHYQHFK